MKQSLGFIESIKARFRKSNPCIHRQIYLYCSIVGNNYVGRDKEVLGKGSEGTYQTIINQISPCDEFYSCFLGHCKVIQHLNRPARVVGFDRDATVIRKWQTVDWMDARRHDAISFLQSYTPPADQLGGTPLGGTPRVCLFCDPPYLIETRRSTHRYPYELTTEQHRDLLTALRRIHQECPTVQILLCTLPNVTYEPHYRTGTASAIRTPHAAGQLRSIYTLIARRMVCCKITAT